jgi:hypothetical protein
MGFYMCSTGGKQLWSVQEGSPGQSLYRLGGSTGLHTSVHAPPCQPHAAAAALTSLSPPPELSPLLQWIAGTEPPAYVEVGPYAFATSEVRYNMKYDKDWNQVRQMCQGASSTPGSEA